MSTCFFTKQHRLTATGQHGQDGQSVAPAVVGGILLGLDHVTTHRLNMAGQIVVRMAVFQWNIDLAIERDVIQINQGISLLRNILFQNLN